jgi:hypothetical protein
VVAKQIQHQWVMLAVLAALRHHLVAVAEVVLEDTQEQAGVVVVLMVLPLMAPAALAVVVAITHHLPVLVAVAVLDCLEVFPAQQQAQVALLQV